jgi:putative ABC transport system permease protein
MSISLPDLITSTCKSLGSNVLRSGLTMFGVFMGVAAVSATLNVGSITEAQIKAKLANRDKPYIVPYLTPEGNFSVENLDVEDKRILEKDVPQIHSISSLSEVFLSSAQFEDQEASELSCLGVSQNYIETTGRKILQGRFFNAADFNQYRPVAVIDLNLANLLFEGQKPIGKDIFADGVRLTVVGVTETKTEGAGLGTSGTIWLPQTFAKVLGADSSTSALQIGANKLEDIPVIKEQVEKILNQRHPKSIVYTDDNTEDLLREKEVQATVARALYLLALIALLISGVGIANISIASVIERIKEIGLRRAIGATRGDVMIQFILESAILSLVAGTAAILVTHNLTTMVTTKFVRVPYQFSSQSTALSLGSALLVGVGASFFPALTASRVNVIEAIRTN